ncbi:hypothetical protein [Bradyrhizobium sp. BR 1432]|uniref:hypothetical protein n=1 Tax=Bradyrhizobium sp. BR 1432 TaxID=3447966 RepID=UPI003EE614A0
MTVLYDKMEFPKIQDQVDFAAFMLGVSHTDLYRYETGGRQFFVFNSPELVQRFFEDTDCYEISEHHYRNIVNAYAPSAFPLLKLKAISAGPMKPYDAIRAELSKSAAGFQERIAPFVGDQSTVEISHEIKRWMLILMAKLLYNFDISRHADEFIARGNFIEEWLANVEHAHSWPREIELTARFKRARNFFRTLRLKSRISSSLVAPRSPKCRKIWSRTRSFVR